MIATKPRKSKASAKERDRSLVAKRALASSAREIGSIPQVENQERRDACEKSFRKFCETYFPEAFYLGFSKDHEELMARMEECANDGGLVAFALPRGSGKSTISVKLAEWVLLYGKRKFLAVIGAREDKADDLINGIKMDLMHNKLLLADFPEVCFPLAALEGEARRAGGQTVDGVRTCSVITSGKLVLPTVEGSKASGSIVAACGITGNIRGLQHTTTSGKILRPDFVLIDDPQTMESAQSPSQTMQRLTVINGDILGLAGPGVRISGFCPITVICKDDMADRLLDSAQSPEWGGIRKKLIEVMPKNMDLWEEYQALRDEDLRQGRGEKGDAYKMYMERREEMDEGAVVAWEERKSPMDVSALQAAMHLLFRDSSTFYSEYQNDPQVDSVSTKYLQALEVAKKFNGHKKGAVPDGCTHVTVGIDCQGDVLYYTATAWMEDMTGNVLEYGVFPPQKTKSLALHDCKVRMMDYYPNTGKLGAMLAGIKELAGALGKRKWKGEDGSAYTTSLVLIDSGFETSTVYDAISTMESNANILPFKGVACKATSKPIGEWRRDRGSRFGDNWLIPKPKGRALRLVIADAWQWKSRLFDGLSLAVGDSGCISVYSARSGGFHNEWAAQICSNVPKVVSCASRTITEWRSRPGADDHLLDCLNMSAVAASICGCKPKDSAYRVDTTAPVDKSIQRELNNALVENITTPKRKTISLPEEWES